MKNDLNGCIKLSDSKMTKRSREYWLGGPNEGYLGKILGIYYVIKKNSSFSCGAINAYDFVTKLNWIAKHAKEKHWEKDFNISWPHIPKYIPWPIPNIVTRKAILASARGDVKSFNSVKELMDDLENDEND